MLVASVVAAVVGAVVGVGGYALSAHVRPGTTIHVTTGAAGSPARTAGTVSGAAGVIGPSVVTINVTGSQGAGTGSGVILSGSGNVLTNNHVVTLDASTAATANQISVTLSDGSSHGASVVGTDPVDDLAVIRISGGGALTAATFAKSSALQVGQDVVAVGAPLGLSNTVTSGIVSALGRPVQAGTNGETTFDAIQTDAAINPGNSGGPLVDLSGHVVGINSAIATAGSSGGGQSSAAGSIGIGFAIPSDQATRIAAQLIATGKATHAVLGVEVQPAAAAQAQAPTSSSGATVASVDPAGPAAKAGIATGDVIVAVGDQRVDDPVSLVAAVRSHAPGETVPVVVERNGVSRTVPVTLAGSTAD
ncbi:MAG: S1C family serine protease [Blastococcus sp.]